MLLNDNELLTIKNALNNNTKIVCKNDYDCDRIKKLN